MEYPTALAYPDNDVFPPLGSAQPFDVSTDVGHDFRERGYVFLPQLLDRDEVLDVRDRLLRIAGDAGWLDPHVPYELGVSGAHAASPGDGDDYVRAYAAAQSTESFHALGHDERLLSTVATIAAEPTFCLPLKMARYAFPAALTGATATPCHQDYFYVQGSCDLMTAWVPLGDYEGGESGRLAVLSGSHRLGLWGADWLEPLPRHDVEWRIGDYRAGDVLLFHCLTVHTSELNRRDRVRVSVDYRYQPVGDQVVPTSLLPHYDLATWDELYEDWSGTAPQHYWTELGLQVIPRRDELADHRGKCRPRLVQT